MTVFAFLKIAQYRAISLALRYQHRAPWVARHFWKVADGVGAIGSRTHPATWFPTPPARVEPLPPGVVHQIVLYKILLQ